MNDRGILASCSISPLSKITNPEISTRFKLLQDLNSNRLNDLLIHNTIPITLHDNSSTFRDTGKEFEVKVDLLKMITNKNYNVDLASLLDKKLLFEFAREMHFEVKTQGNKSTRDRSLMKLLRSPGLMVSALVVSQTNFSSSDPDELCSRGKLLQQENQTRKKF